MGIIERMERVGMPKLDAAQRKRRKAKDDWITYKRKEEAEQRAIFGR